jgi:hypothetical protein
MSERGETVRHALVEVTDLAFADVYKVACRLRDEALAALSDMEAEIERLKADRVKLAEKVKAEALKLAELHCDADYAEPCICEDVRALDLTALTSGQGG